MKGRWRRCGGDAPETGVWPAVAVGLIVATLVGCGRADRAAREAAERAIDEAAVDLDAAPGAAAGAPNTLTPAEEAAGWTLLFDGTSGAGWRGYNQAAFPESGWEIRDGALIVVPQGETDAMSGGDLVTEETFESFDFRFEFKLAPVANSGVFYLVQEAEGAAIWQLAPEYQVLDDPAYLERDLVVPTQLTGANYDLHAASVRPLRPVGEWNQGRILVDGNRVEHWLNGEKMVEYEIRSSDWEARVAASKFAEFPAYGRASSGPLGLQDHGGEVWYRNLKIRRLER